MLSVAGPVVGLAAVYLLFAAIGPDTFVTSRNLETMARQTAIVGTVALGMTLLIISGGIDLSVGSVVALSSVVVAIVLNAGYAPWLACVAAVATGAACGVVSGVLVTRLRVAPFIVTLGMLLLVRGVAMGLAGEQKINAPITWLGDLLATLPPAQRWQVLPPGVWLVVVLAAATSAALRYTTIGRHLAAMGSSEGTARLCGVPVERRKLQVYTLSAALAGASGVLQFSRLTVGDPTVATGLELDVIAAVVIGGGSLSGGEGSVLGTIVGALIMTVIRSGSSQMGLPNWVQEIVTAVIIVFAVALDRWRHRTLSEART
ncbi:MAG: ABC transporter permease [Vicinamibacterales bacterium]